MKSRQLKYFTIALTICLVSSSLKSQVLNSIIDKFPISINEKLSFLPAPSLSYKPETNLSFGTALIASYSPDPDKAIDLSTAQLDFVYTLNKQLIIDLDHHILLRQGKWIIYGSNSFYHYPELYYSLSEEIKAENIEYKRVEFDNKLFYRLRGNWFAGIVHRVQHISSVKYPVSGSFSSEKPVGYSGGLSHGIGLGTLYDHRVNLLNPETGGSFFSLNTGIFSKKLGSQFEFMRLEVDYRKYLKLGRNKVIAVQALGIFNQGDPPFKLTGQLGGGQIMRGYYHGRFRNRQMLACQIEMRLALYNRIGMTGFASIGNTAYNLAGLTSQPPLTGYGIGLRYMLDKKNRANLRLDFAIGKHSRGIYFGYGEAF